jgi:uncharacterized surface protein with fasciclin (FAS1) repeats
MKLRRSFALLLLLIAVSSLLVLTRAQDNGTRNPKDDMDDTTEPPAIAPGDEETDAPTPVPPGDETEAPSPAGPGPETEQPTPAATSEPPTPAPATLDVALQGESELTTLLAAVEAAGLQGLLNDTNAVYTVFAPMNSAFEKLPEDTISKLLTPPWILHLQNLLAFHVAEEFYSIEDLEDVEIGMLNLESVTAVSSGSPENGTSFITLSSEFTEEALVTSDGLTASNGVAYKIDSVLLPAWVGVDALTFASETNDFSTLIELVNETGITIPTDGSFTLLAPTNQAFNALFNSLSDEELESLTNDTEALADILGGHLFSQVYPSASLTDGMTLTSVAGTTVTVMLEQRGQETNVMLNDAQVQAADILVSNGIVHSIDTVLLPTTLSPSSTAMPTGTKAPAAAPVTSAPSSDGGDGTPPAPSPPTPPSPTADLTLPPDSAPSTAPLDSGARSLLYTKMSGLLLSCAAMFILV